MRPDPEHLTPSTSIRSTIARGIPFTIHNDTPIVPADITATLWSAVNRQTRSGQTLGAGQTATVREALEAVTTTAAYQFYEEHRKGSLAIGKLADIVVLSDNPLAIDPASLNQLKVLKTYKEGIQVYPPQD